MTRRATWSLLVVIALVLQGCPVFPDDVRNCSSDSQCPSGYQCELASGVCVRPSQLRLCREPAECGPREVCGSDGRCHVGSCAISGCVSGYDCAAPNGTWECIAEGGGAGASGAAGSASAGAAGAD